MGQVTTCEESLLFTREANCVQFEFHVLTVSPRDYCNAESNGWGLKFAFVCTMCVSRTPKYEQVAPLSKMQSVRLEL